MLDRDEDILQAAEDWKKAGRGVALATVVETWGSAPRPAGSSLVINDEGQPKLLEFGVADESAFNVGLSCGGTIRIFVEKVGQS